MFKWLDKERLIKEEFPSLNNKQISAVQSIIDGYIHLIDESSNIVPTKKDAIVFANLIKSNIFNILKITEVYLA